MPVAIKEEVRDLPKLNCQQEEVLDWLKLSRFPTYLLQICNFFMKEELVGADIRLLNYNNKKIKIYV